MAKKRITQPLLQNVPTTVSPVARAVDTFVRPAAEQDVNADLKAFVDGITPVLQQAAQEEKRRQLEETRAVVTGLKERELFQARSMARKMLLESGQAFTENQDKYVADEAKLINDRQEFFNKNLQGLEEAGMSPEVVMAMRNELEAGDLKFYGEVYDPLVFDKKIRDATDVLQEAINSINEAVMLPREQRVELLTKEIEDFEKAYPFVPKEIVNATVENTALVTSARLDENGFPIGKNIYSDWMVKKNRHNVGANQKLWADIENNAVKRTEEQARATKSFTASVDNAIKPFLNNLADELVTNVDLYIDNEEAYTQRVEQAIDEVVSGIVEARSLNKEEEATVRQAVENAWALKASQEVNKVYDQKAAANIESDVVTALINFSTPTGGEFDLTADVGFEETFGEYFERVTAEANLATDAQREGLATKLLEQIKTATPSVGANIPMLNYLGSKGYLNKEENQQLKQDILKLHEKFTRTATQKSDMVTGIGQFLETRNKQLMPTTYTNESGKEVAWKTTELDKAFEENFGKYMTLAEKMELYYRPNGRLPKDAVNNINSGKGYWSIGDLGTPDNPSPNITLANISYTQTRDLERAGVSPQTALGNADDATRYKLIKYQMEENGLSFEQALRSVQTISNDQLKIKVTDVEEAGNQLDALTPGWTNFHEAEDSAVNANKVVEIASNIKRLDPSLTDKEAIQAAVTVFEEDHIIIEDSEGYSTTLTHLDTDVSDADPVTTAEMQAKLFKESSYIQNYVATNFKGFEDSFGIRFRTSDANPDMVDVLITNGGKQALGVIVTVGKQSLFDGTALDALLEKKVFGDPDDELEDRSTFMETSVEDFSDLGFESDMSTITDTPEFNLDDLTPKIEPEPVEEPTVPDSDMTTISSSPDDDMLVEPITTKQVDEDSTLDEVGDYVSDAFDYLGAKISGEDMEVFKEVAKDAEVNKVLAMAATNKNLKEPQRILNEILMPIAYVESKGHNIRQAPRSITSKFGPATGIYQFEGDARGKGGSGSFKVALQRTKNFFKDDVPQWVIDTQGTDKSAMDLTPSQQTVVLVADFMMKSGADISKVLNGSQTLEDFWIKSHWAGSKKDEVQKRKQFRRDYSEYLELLEE